MVTHGILRVLVLAYSGTRAFNLVTVLPQLMLWPLGAALIVSHDVSSWHVSVGFAFAFLVGGLFALVVIRRSVIGDAELHLPLVSFGELMGYGGAAWLVAVLNSGVYIFCIRVIESKAGLDEVGIFTMGIVLVQVVLTPFNYAAPLLFKRWVDSRPGKSASIRIAVFTALGASMFSLGLISLTSLSLSADGLGGYARLDELKWAFLGVAIVEAVIRTTGAIANSHGRPWIATLGEALRFLTITAAVGLGFVSGSSQATLSWLIAASLASAVMLTSLIRIQRTVMRC